MKANNSNTRSIKKSTLLGRKYNLKKRLRFPYTRFEGRCIFGFDFKMDDRLYVIVGMGIKEF